MHILICDDDAAFGTRMAEYVTVTFAARSVLVHTAVCTSAARGLATPGLELYQLAFLDVDMDTVNGMVLGRQLKQKMPRPDAGVCFGLSGICAGRLHGERLPLPAQAGHCAHPAQAVWTTCWPN